jgi:APA family basic amino acid/polyamine antiporter
MAGACMFLSVAAYLLRLARVESTFAGRPLLAQTLGAALALAFSIWMIGETGKDTVFDGVIMIFIGIPVYLADQWRRTRRATADAAVPTTSDSA